VVETFADGTRLGTADTPSPTADPWRGTLGIPIERSFDTPGEAESPKDLETCESLWHREHDLIVFGHVGATPRRSDLTRAVNIGCAVEVDLAPPWSMRRLQHGLLRLEPIR